MPNPDINFRNIRQHRNSQNDGFEELTRQLVLADPPAGALSIEHRGPGADGGVELLVRFPNGCVWGWQSKYFPDGFGSSEVGQLKKSFSAALANYPTLERYYVAIPRNLSGHAEGENDTQTKHWQTFKEWCHGQAAAAHRTVEIVLWNDTYFVSRLQKSDAAHSGMRLYWFDDTVLDQAWFERQLEKSLGFIGRRYREVDHIDVKIGDTLEILKKDPSFRQRLETVWSAIESSRAILATIIQALGTGGDRIADFNRMALVLREISELAAIADPDALRNENIASLLKRLRALEEDSSVDFVLNRARFSTRTDPARPEHDRETYVYSVAVRDHLTELRREIMTAALEFSNRESELFRVPILLIEGEAGIGKSHIIAREVQRHVLEGYPAVFVPGRTLDHGGKPESEILEYLDLKDLRFETFLGALDAAAKASGRPALVAIDGINESFDAAGWEPGLPKLMAQFKSFERIGLCVSIRSAYKKLCVRPGLDLVEVPHTGFSENLGEAAREYLDHHGIERPSVPIFELRDILYNPLFLTTAVDFLVSTKQTSFPRGLDSVGKLIDFWLTAIENNLTSKRYDRIEQGDGKIHEAARRLAAEMAASGREYVPFDVANTICETVIDLGRPLKSSDRLLARLIDEGMLLDTPDYRAGEFGKSVSFAFQKFSDYFIADAILRECGDALSLAVAIKPGGKFHYLFEGEQAWQFVGPRVALLSLTPLRLGVELPSIEPDIRKQVRFSVSDFVSSLHWRQGSGITEETQHLLETLRPSAAKDGPRIVDDLYFDLLLRLATIPDCRLNARYLKAKLAGMSLGDRDATWSLYLVGKTETDDQEWSVAQELINWSWIAPVAEIGSNTIHLIATVIGLMTSTMDRQVRDCATKALSSLLIKFPSEIPLLIEEFKDWDDAYVRERVLAAALGGALSCEDNSILKSATEAVYRMVFSKQPVERHAWVRRYASLIVEHSVNRGVDLGQEVVDRAAPPYASAPIAEWPTLAELLPLYEDARQIFSSVIGYLSRRDGSEAPTMAGDFGRYTMSGIDNSFSAEIRGSVPPTTREMEIARFWDEAERSAPQVGPLRDNLERAVAEMAEGSMMRLLKGFPDVGETSEDWDNNVEELARHIGNLDLTGDDEEEGRLQQAHDDLEASLLTLLSPELQQRFRTLKPFSPRSGGEIERFSIHTARYWIVDRAIKLGWSQALHEKVERESLGHSQGRHDHGVERVGKKYQHIALQELIGYLADHHWYIDWNDPPSVLQKLERFNSADIDPTFLAGDFSKPANTFFPEGIVLPEMSFTPSEPQENMEWTETTDDIPDAIPFLVQRDNEGQEWCLQLSLSHSAGRSSYASADPFRSAQYRIELVLFAEEDIEKLDRLTSATMAGDDGNLFDFGHDAQEFYTQRSVRHLTEPAEFERATKIAGIEFGRFVEAYPTKRGEYDHSGVSSEKVFNVPTASLFTSQQLRPNDGWSTFHVSEDGRPAFTHDRNRADFGVSVVRADVIGAFAKPRGLKPVWIVWVEKDGGKGSDGLAEDHGLFSRKDFIGFYYQDDNGWHGHLMRFRD